MKFASLFAGIGGLDYGFIRSGWSPVYVNEFHENTALSYENIHGHDVDRADIQSVDSARIPRAEVVIGGPPCQSFSLVGKRLPEDPRGALVHRFSEIVMDLNPDAFVMENVPGILSSKVDGQKLIDLLQTEFQEAGYFVNRMTLTATDYGIPQRRRRVILLGSKVRLPQVPLPSQFFDRIGVKVGGWPISARAAIGDLNTPVSKGERARYKRSRPSDFARIMRSEGGSSFTLHEMPRMSDRDTAYVKHIPPGGNYTDIPDSIATNRVKYFKQTGGRTTTYGRLHADKPAYTINTAFRRPNVGCNFHYEQDRLITAREAMRFQSMPDHWDLIFGAIDERNTMIGNAVPPLLSHAICMAVEDSLR